jgi:acyl carrier protein
MKSQILEILQETRPESNFDESENFIEDGLLDSFDMVMLIDELEEKFGVSIDGEEIIASNFTSLDSIKNLVEISRRTS